MRSSASTPAFASLDAERTAARQKVLSSLNRSQSLTNSAVADTASAQFSSLVNATPFFALPGVSSTITKFSRVYSKATSLGSSHAGQQRLSSASHHRNSSTASSDYSEDYPATPSPRRPSVDFELGLEEDADIIPDHHLNPPLTSPLLFAVSCAVLSSFQTGFNSALLNVPEAVIRQSLSLSDTNWSIVISIFCIGGLVGCSVGGYLSDRLGRKNFLVTNNVLFIVGALLQALSHGFVMLAAGRFCVGVACGGCTVVVPLYLGEISPANLRGSLGTMSQFATVIGILVAVLMGRPMGGAAEWRYLMGLVMLPSMLQIVMSASLLESPLWLIVTGGSKGLIQAEEILCSLRGMDNVDLDLDAMIHHKQSMEESSTSTASSSSIRSTVRAIFRRSNRRPLLTGFLLQVSQQLSGINAVFFYSTAFFVSAKVSDPWLGSVLCCAVNVLATWLALSIMDRMGRKTLLLISAIGMALSAIALTYFLTLPTADDTRLVAAHRSPLSDDAAASASPSSSSSSLSPQVSSYLSILFVLLYVTFFELGLGPIPWTIGVEIYPAAVRGAAMSLSSTVNWLSNFMVSLAFPHLSARLDGYAFVPFVVALLLTVVFVVGWVPETRGKTLEEIQEDMGVDAADDREEAEQEQDDSADAYHEPHALQPQKAANYLSMGRQSR